MNNLDKITLKHGGRFYLAKDSRISREIFAQADHRSEAYLQYRKKQGAKEIFSSEQSKRFI